MKKNKLFILLFLPSMIIGALSLSGCTQDNIKDLNDRMNNVENDIATLKTEAESLRKQISTLQTELSTSIESVKKEYTKMINDLEKEILSLNNEIVELNEKLKEETIAIKDDYDTKIINLTSTLNLNITALQEKITDAELKIADLEKKHDSDIKEAKEDYESKISLLEQSFNDSLEKVNASITDLQNQITNLDTKLASDKKELQEDYESKISILEQNHNNDIIALNSSVDKNEKAIEELEKKHEEDIKNVTDDYNKAVTDLETEHDNDVNVLKTAIDNNKTSIEDLKNKHEEDISKIKDDYKKLVNDLNAKLESEVDALKKGIETNTKEIATFKTRYEDDKKAITADYESKIKAVADDYTKKIEDTNAEITKLSTQVNDLKTELEGKIQSLKDDYNAQLTLLTSRVSELEKGVYCTVTFDTCGGTIIEPQVLKYGSHIVKPSNPTKEGYDFNGWKFKGISISDEFFLYYNVDENITISADFSKHDYSFEVSMSNVGAGYFTVNLESGNKTCFKSDVPYGTNISLTAYELNGATFINWTQEGSVVSTDKNYIFTLSSSNCNLVANYTLPPIECKFLNYDGSLITTQYIENGGNVIYNGPVPMKPNDGASYNSWNGWDKSLNNITTDTTFIAQFKNTGDTYYHYCVFVNFDGEQLASASTFSGGSVAYEGLTPKRPQHAEGINITNYSFSTWDKSLTNINEATTFVAMYSTTEFTGYKVEFLDSDSTLLYSYYCESGTTAIYPYELPFSYDAINVKMFIGWDGSLKNINEPKTFTAQYRSISRTQNGEYPQSLVKDADTISALDAISITDSKGYKTYKGEKYLGYSGTSYKDNDMQSVTSDYHYYKVEPIKWKYLTTDGSNVFVATEHLLDAHRFNEYYSGVKTKTDYNGFTSDNIYANNYKFSEIRTWLNTTFLNQAFDDKSKISTTNVDNSVASTRYSSNQYVCPSTNDKIFLLSRDELLNFDLGFSSNEYAKDPKRQCKTTEYARARGMGYILEESFLFNGSYYSRSPKNDYSYRACFVNYDGLENMADGILNYWDVNNSRYGVRLALNFNIV